MQYHSCINNLASVCSAWVNAQLFIYLLSPVFIYRLMGMRTHGQETLCKFKEEEERCDVDGHAKRQGQNLDSKCSDSSGV